MHKSFLVWWDLTCGLLVLFHLQSNSYWGNLHLYLYGGIFLTLSYSIFMVSYSIFIVLYWSLWSTWCQILFRIWYMNLIFFYIPMSCFSNTICWRCCLFFGIDFGFIVKNQVAIVAWTYIWIFYPIPLIYIANKRSWIQKRIWKKGVELVEMGEK